MSVAYQGLAGAFSEAAAAALFPGQPLDARRTFAEVFDALESAEVDAAVVRTIAPARLAGRKKTSIVYTTKNEPGALTRSLQPFATAGLQLTKIESRPSRAAPFDYVFYLDFEGDPRITPAREALALMRTCCEWVLELGTYPAATEVLEADVP